MTGHDQFSAPGQNQKTGSDRPVMVGLVAVAQDVGDLVTSSPKFGEKTRLDQTLKH